jgi:Mrp family chromosome partitioning ATPase/capsular polysaccharide biosynthesis protein
MAVDVASGTPGYTASAEQAVGPYLRAVRRHWKVVVAVTLLCGLIAAFTLSRVGSNYQSSASILVTPIPAGNSSFVGIGTVVDTSDPARTVQTAAALIDTPEAAALAAKKLGHGWTQGAVLAAVSVTPRGASDVLAVTANASNGTDAAKVANAFAASAIQYRAGVVQAQVAKALAGLDAQLAALKSSPNSPEAQNIAATIAALRGIQGSGREPTMSVSQLAQPATSPTGAPRWLVLLLALVGGFVLGSVAAVGLETFTRPVRDREELTALFNVPVLATIPRVSGRGRSGKSLPPWEFSPLAFEQMRLLRVQLSMGTVSPVIMVTSAGAGDGKTTVAAALAAAFAEVDEDVILMDLDLRKPDLANLLDVKPEPGELEIGSSLPVGVPIPVPRLPRVKVVPAPRGDFAKFESVIRRLPELVARARRTAGCVIIDTAPVGEVSEALRIAPICDQVVFVARPRHTDRRRLVLARDLLQRADAPLAGMVLVDRDAGGPRGYYSYGYGTSPNGEMDDERHPRLLGEQATEAERAHEADVLRDSPGS